MSQFEIDFELRLNNLFKNRFGPLHVDCLFCLLDLFCDSIAAFSIASGFSFNLICFNIPTKSSSTLWFRTADVSMYLQSYSLANRLATETNQWNTIINLIIRWFINQSSIMIHKFIIMLHCICIRYELRFQQNKNQHDFDIAY